jgi:hypothetical protein
MNCWSGPRGIGVMFLVVLNGTFLRDTKGNHFLLVVDVYREIRNVQEAAMFHLHVGSTFKFPVVLAWLEAGKWHMAGPQPWKGIAEQTELTRLRLYQIPVSDPEIEKWIREKKNRSHGDF